MTEPTRVLFVCLGNICRSPLAEAVVRKRARKRGLDDHFRFGSAGIGDWNLGMAADPRTHETALRHGLSLSGHCATQITSQKIADWHWFVAMDSENRHGLTAMGAPQERVLLMRQFETNGETQDIPDPYNEGADGFEFVYTMIRKNADRLLDYLLTSERDGGA